MGIKAIKTKYANIEFRSRLEARWAVFFDELVIPWEYEYECFDLEFCWYLPDFYLPSCNTWIEIKPYASYEAVEKCIALSKYTNESVILICGSLFRDQYICFPFSSDFEGSVPSKFSCYISKGFCFLVLKYIPEIEVMDLLLQAEESIRLTKAIDLFKNKEKITVLVMRDMLAENYNIDLDACLRASMDFIRKVEERDGIGHASLLTSHIQKLDNFIEDNKNQLTYVFPGAFDITPDDIENAKNEAVSRRF